MTHAAPQFLSASTLTGDDVKNPQGEALGDLKDIMIDTLSGKVAYGVLSFGGEAQVLGPDWARRAVARAAQASLQS